MPPALTLAPHRALFTTGALATLLPMLWWLLELLGRASGIPLLDHPVPAMLAHGQWMLYGVFPPFMAGFIFTAGPRWLGVNGPGARAFAPLAAAWLLGHLATLAGLVHNWLWLYQSGQGLFAAGMLGLCGVWLGVIRQSRQPDRRHAWLVAAGFALGAAGALAGLGWALTGRAELWSAMRGLALWGFLLPVFLTVAHRMLPFFSANVLQPYQPWRPDGLLSAFWAGSLGHLLLSLLPWAWPLSLWDAGFAALLGYTSWRWGVRRSLINPLLAMLHLSFAWAALALALSALTPWLALGAAATHALGIGLFASLMMGFVSRVSLGHSGQPLRAAPWLWRLYLTLHGLALLRLASDWLPPFAAIGHLLTAAGWLLLWGIWCARFVPLYCQPRADGQPG